MKIDFKNGNYIIYLNKYNVINMDFNNTKVLENDLKDLLLRLKKYYAWGIFFEEYKERGALGKA